MEIPRHWRLKQQRYGLVGTKDSQGVSFPPTPVGKFGNEAQARSMAVAKAAKKAEVDLEIYTVETLIDQYKEHMFKENADFLNELTERGIPISFSR